MIIHVKIWGVAEDEIVRHHHRLSGHEFEQILEIERDR